MSFDVVHWVVLRCPQQLWTSFNFVYWCCPLLRCPQQLWKSFNFVYWCCPLGCPQVPTAAVDILQFCLLMLSTGLSSGAHSSCAHPSILSADVVLWVVLKCPQQLCTSFNFVCWCCPLGCPQVPTTAVDVSKAVQQPLDISQPALTTEVAGGDGVEVSNIA